MPFSRRIASLERIEPDVLTSRLAGIGMNFAATPARDANIEDTIVLASMEGMEKPDLRVLAVLVTWFGIHSPWVNADRLTKLVSAQSSTRVHAFWSALARWQQRDRRFFRLAKLYVGPPQDLIDTGMEFHLSRHGQDARFEESPIRVAANVLRDRLTDVLQPTELASQHRAYRWRIVIGPTYRADMWAALEAEPTLSPAALAKRTYGSFSTAWHVCRDFGLLAKISAKRPALPANREKPKQSA